MNAVDLNDINTYLVEQDWVGDWWIISPDERYEYCVTEGGRKHTYSEALEGIEDAHYHCATDDNQTPFLDWKLWCDRRPDDDLQGGE